jgi:translation elongation factor EF-4
VFGSLPGEPEFFSSVTRGEPDGSPVALSLYSSKNSDAVSHTRALIFDSYFDDYRGVVLYVRVFEGEIRKNAEILMMAAGTKGLALEVGVLTPKIKDSMHFLT